MTILRGILMITNMAILMGIHMSMTTAMIIPMSMTTAMIIPMSMTSMVPHWSGVSGWKRMFWVRII